MQSPISKFGAKLRASARDMSLIVVSILIAFFLDAWWDEQVEQAEIRDNLRAVHVDFLSTKEELSKVIDANVAYIENVTKLISLELDDLATLDPTVKSALTYLLPRGGLTFDPVLGSVEALISSGQLNRIRNLEVRSLIATWPALMDEIGEDQQILIDTYMANQERSVKLDIYLLSLHGELSADFRTNDDDILRTVIQDTEMLNRLAAHRFAIQALDEELHEVDQHLDKILRVLEGELEIDERK